MRKKINVMLLSDFYKINHRIQYPKKTEVVYSTWTPRASRMKGVDKVVVFGHQAFIKKYLIEFFNENFFGRPKQEIVAEYKRFIKFTLGVADPETKHIEDLHDLGYLPLEIKALQEGTISPIRVPVLTIRNTDSRFFWLTNYVETLASCSLWQASTSATIAHEYRKILEKYAMETVGTTDFVQFEGHDFSFRGMTSLESAISSGMGHLTSFVGTDTIPAIWGAEEYYNANIEKELIGTSIPASEHSIECAYDDDMEYFVNLISEVHPEGFVSIVSDGRDFWDVIGRIIPALKDKIMARNGRVVIRPDCYSEDTKILTNRGWTYFKDLNPEDFVAQVLEDGTYEFVKPLKYVEQDYDGDMFLFKDHHGKLDILVTPNHRMIFNKDGKWKIQTAEQVKVGAWGKSVIRSAKSRNMNTSLSPLERLKIAFQADGCYASRMKSCIRFSFSKQRKINRMKKLCEDAKLEYKIYSLSDGKFEFNIKVDAELFSKNFDWINISNLCSNWCQEFIEEISHWDSTIRSDNRIKFDTTNASVIKIVELIALSAGYGVLLSEFEDNRKDIFSKVYTANILKNNRIDGQSQVKEKVQYNGKVYCVQVPSGMLLVKRNRSTLVCGNSGDPVLILCGNPDGKTELERIGAVEALWNIFGGTVTPKGYKLLDSHIGLIYGDAITLQRAEEICKRLKAKGFASINSVYGIGSFCVTPDTLILCSDLLWRKAGDLKVGQEIIAFDENPCFGGNKHATRRYKRAKITANGTSRKRCMKITTNIGPPISASRDHPWLVYAKNRSWRNIYFNDIRDKEKNQLPRSAGLVWKRTFELVPGDKIAFIGNPWEIDNTRSGGWFAGILDGEGCLGKDLSSHRSIAAWKINVSQNVGLVLDEIKKEFKKRGFSYYINTRKCQQIILTGGWRKMIEFLGTVRPIRLIDKLSEALNDGPALKKDSTYELSTVTSIEDVGIQKVASITTSSGTFITGGYLSHNSYQYNTRDTFGWALKSTHVVIDGKEKNIFKDPKTDSGIKKSQKGCVIVVKDGNSFKFIDELKLGDVNRKDNEMVTIFENGKLIVDDNFSSIRNRIKYSKFI